MHQALFQGLGPFSPVGGFTHTPRTPPSVRLESTPVEQGEAPSKVRMSRLISARWIGTLETVTDDSVLRLLMCGPNQRRQDMP